MSGHIKPHHGNQGNLSNKKAVGEYDENSRQAYGEIITMDPVPTAVTAGSTFYNTSSKPWTN